MIKSNLPHRLPHTAVVPAIFHRIPSGPISYISRGRVLVSNLAVRAMPMSGARIARVIVGHVSISSLFYGKLGMSGTFVFLGKFQLD